MHICLSNNSYWLVGWQITNITSVPSLLAYVSLLLFFFFSLSLSLCVCVCCSGLFVCYSVTRQLRPFYLHQWVDVRDTQGTWLEAQVIALEPAVPLSNTPSQQFKIIDTKHSQDNSHLLAARNTEEHKSRETVMHPLFTAPTPTRIKVHYKGWKAKYDEFLVTDPQHPDQER